MSKECKYVRKDVMDAKVDQDLILFDAEGGKYFGTAEIGAAIWEELAQPVTLHELCTRLMVDYDVSPEECEADTSAFIDSLLDAGLVLAS